MNAYKSSQPRRATAIEPADRKNLCGKLRELKHMVRKFKEREQRSQVLMEVIEDQHLLLEPKWNLYFIADFYQLYTLAFPEVVRCDKEVVGNEIRIDIKEIPERQKEVVLRETLRKAIPFFGCIRVPPPVLISPYRRELDIQLRSQAERLLRAEMLRKLRTLLPQVAQIRCDWNESLDAVQRDTDETPAAAAAEVMEFSKLTAQGFYCLAFAHATTPVTAAFRALEHILTNTEPKPHVSYLPAEHEAEISHTNIDPWLNLLSRYRPQMFSNIIDAQAIALVMRLNELASREGRRDVYFLLSDTRALAKALNKFDCAGGDVLKELRLTPFIKHRLFPPWVNSQGLHVLRTSDHFEEFLQAYHEALPVQIENLERRLEQLLPQCHLLTTQFEDIDRTCQGSYPECTAETRERCRRLREDIAAFLRNEDELANLHNIIHKEKAFQPLLNFVHWFLQDVVYPDARRLTGEHEEIRKLSDEYDQFFSQRYGNALQEKLETAFHSLYDKVAGTILTIGAQSIEMARAPAQLLRNRLRRMFEINYQRAFSGNQRLRTLLNDLFLPSSDEDGSRGSRDWYREIFEMAMAPPRDAEINLLVLSLLYCYDAYTECEWLARRWIEDHSSELASSGKQVEFAYMLAAAEARQTFQLKDHSAAREAIGGVLAQLDAVELQFPGDPRIPHLKGKILARVYLFGIDPSSSVLADSIASSRKALDWARHIAAQGDITYQPLQISLTNNIVYCSAKLPPADTNPQEMEQLAGLLYPHTDEAHVLETVACYLYSLARKRYEERKLGESNGQYQRALTELSRAIDLGIRQDINRQELTQLNIQMQHWKAEHAARFGHDGTDAPVHG